MVLSGGDHGRALDRAAGPGPGSSGLRRAESAEPICTSRRELPAPDCPRAARVGGRVEARGRWRAGSPGTLIGPWLKDPVMPLRRSGRRTCERAEFTGYDRNGGGGYAVADDGTASRSRPIRGSRAAPPFAPGSSATGHRGGDAARWGLRVRGRTTSAQVARHEGRKVFAHAAGRRGLPSPGRQFGPAARRDAAGAADAAISSRRGALVRPRLRH
jgi:hypothetical protein